MRLTINLATRQYVNMRLLNIGLALALALLAGMLVLRVREIAYNQVELGQVRHLAATAGERPGALKVSEAQLQEVQKRISFANALIAKKSVNWLALLDHLEEVVPSGVTLSEITPGSQGNSITLGGIATGFGGIRAFIENLEKSSYFSDVFLMSQAETKVGQNQRGTTFTITCKVATR